MKKKHEKSKGRHPELAEGSQGCSPGRRCFDKLSMTEMVLSKVERIEIRGGLTTTATTTDNE